MNELRLRAALPADLPEINDVITAAVMNWPLAERVKRLSLPVVTYSIVDMQEYHLSVAVENEALVGVSAWQELSGTKVRGQRAGLLHGLFVTPSLQMRGIGRALMSRAMQDALSAGLEGMLVKAERVSVGYFETQGLVRLEKESERVGNYPYQFWLGAGATERQLQG